MSQRAVAEPAAFERADYMQALNMFDLVLPEGWPIQKKQSSGDCDWSVILLGAVVTRM